MSAEIVKEIIQNNIYLTLATTDRSTPWASPVRYFVDGDYNFYFISHPQSQHARNIQKNPTVSFAIFDSHQRNGTGKGIQVLARCLMVEDIPSVVSDNTGEINQQNKVFKIQPSEFYIPDEKSWKKERIDRRVEVCLR